MTRAFFTYPGQAAYSRAACCAERGVALRGADSPAPRLNVPFVPPPPSRSKP
ncbi:MAG: hypothetical protein LBR16_08115 [Treponema sp.]|nr:hypothetical protein [Treponema sp.]